MNVSPLERWASGIGGGLLTLYGITRRDWAGAALALFGGGFVYRSLTGRSYLYQALRINTNSKEKATTSVADQEGIKVEQAVTINKSAAELYRFWRNFENLPRFMDHLESVTVIDNTHSHWVATAPMNTVVEWDAEISNERGNELIAWRSLDAADINNAGSVHFTPAAGGRGTVVKVVLEYDPPAGYIGAMIARLFGQAPDQQVRYFRDIMTGDVMKCKLYLLVEIDRTGGRPVRRPSGRPVGCFSCHRALHPTHQNRNDAHSFTTTASLASGTPDRCNLPAYPFG